MSNAPDDLRAIALLDEPVRRTLYDWVIVAARPVSRDEAAAGTGVSRMLAAFHLDRLAAVGLLATEFRRLSGRTGPGAGRPAKLYRRGPREVAVTLPERRYELAARLLAASVERSAAEVPPPALRDAARDVGRAMGAAGRASGTGRASAAGRASGTGRASGSRRQCARDELLAVLRGQGYEPCASETGAVRLGNCPFHALAAEHRDLVCGMNLALAEGVIEGLGDRHHVARLDPRPGFCCVAFEEGTSVRGSSDRA